MVKVAHDIALSPTEYSAGIVYLVNQKMLGPYHTVAHEGGTRSGKTYNTILFLIDKALAEAGLQISVCSRDLPHLRKGAMKDFSEIMQARGLWRDDRWKETDHTYRYPNGSYIEFFGADDIGRVSGPSRDYLFCNEVNFFKYIVFRMLVLRTRRGVVIDYNPIHPKHWIYDKVLTRPNCYMWQSTYLDNLPFLPQSQIDEITSMATIDPEWARTYVYGLRGTLQKGQIYTGWTPISIAEYNAVATREVYGIDWGYYPDPNAVVGVKFDKNNRYVRKLLYQNNMSDENFVRTLKALGCTQESIFVAPTDSGGAKACQYMRAHGFPITYTVTRAAGSVNVGIKALRTKNVYYVMDNELDFEVGNYTYLLDSNEELTNQPIDKHNHLLDATRYVELYKPYL
jgi:phage terminase large subunit